MPRALVLLAASSLVALAACGSGPKLTVATAPEPTDPALARGHDVFAAKCNRCHGYPDPSAVSEAEWPEVVQEMGEKAGLADDDRKAVLAYLVASRKK
jgi:cytochrome c5